MKSFYTITTTNDEGSNVYFTISALDVPCWTSDLLEAMPMETIQEAKDELFEIFTDRDNMKLLLENIDVLSIRIENHSITVKSNIVPLDDSKSSDLLNVLDRIKPRLNFEN